MGDFGGPSYSKGTVGIRPSSVNIPANGTAYADIDCNQGGGSTQCVSVTNNTTVSLDKSPTASNAITIWPSVYLSKALDKYVEFELACDFKNLDNGNTETYYAAVGIDAGRTSPSSTGAALRGQAGTCYQQLTPCTVNKIKPSTANICKPITETTSKAQTPSGCASEQTCEIMLIGAGDTSMDKSAKINVTGGLTRILNYGNNFRAGLTNLKCGNNYSISAENCTSNNGACNVSVNPATINKLTGTQSVTVTFSNKQESATSSCNFTYRVFSTGTEYNGFAGQVIYSLSCSGKGRFSSGNTIKVNLPCKSDVVSINLGGKTGDEIGSTGKLQTALYENCLPQSCMYSVNTCATVNVKGKESTWVKVSSTETGLN